jgi:hypothetical protein
MSAFEDIDPDQERPNPVLVAAIAAPFEIPVLPVDELIATARASYNAYHHRPPAASLDQIVVDYLRFRAGFTDRAQPLFAIPGARATRTRTSGENAIGKCVSAALRTRHPNASRSRARYLGWTVVIPPTVLCRLYRARAARLQSTREMSEA